MFVFFQRSILEGPDFEADSNYMWIGLGSALYEDQLKVTGALFCTCVTPMWTTNWPVLAFTRPHTPYHIWLPLKRTDYPLIWLRAGYVIREIFR